MANRNGLYELHSCVCGVKPKYEPTENGGYKLICPNCGREKHGHTKNMARNEWNCANRHVKQAGRLNRNKRHD